MTAHGVGGVVLRQNGSEILTPLPIWVFPAPFFYQFFISVALLYVAPATKRLPICLVPKIPTYRPGDYVISYLWRHQKAFLPATLTHWVRCPEWSRCLCPSVSVVRIIRSLTVLHWSCLWPSVWSK